MGYSTLDWQIDDRVLTLTLNRPDKRNAFSKQMMAEVAEAARQAEAEASVAGVIITGGTQFFSAGADLNEAQQIASPRDGVVGSSGQRLVVAAEVALPASGAGGGAAAAGFAFAVWTAVGPPWALSMVASATSTRSA